MTDTVSLEPQDLAAWDIPAARRCWLINYSENHTFGVETDAGRFVLRVHRLGYQSDAGIESELAWLGAIGRDTDLVVPQPVAGRDGRVLQELSTGAGEKRRCVLFRFIEGNEPVLEPGLVPHFETLGATAATLHRHVAGWRRPEGFERHAWSAGQILDADGLWGDWRCSPDVDATARAVLGRLDARLREDIACYGEGPDRFGLVHADMRLGNLLVEGKRVALIDFDDCGFCWFAYDFAAAVSFHETSPLIPDLKAAWLAGYRRHRELRDEDVAAMDTMVLLRRMALLAWIGSHGETALAQQHRPGYAAGTVALARAYLERRAFEPEKVTIRG